MKNRILVLFAVLLCLFSCKDGKTYIEMLEDERNAISKYIADNGYEVIHTFPADTVFQPNQFFLAENGSYINVVKKGISETWGDDIYMRVTGWHFFSIIGEVAYHFEDHEISPIYYQYNLPPAYQEGINKDFTGQLEVICEGSVYPLKYIGNEGRVKMIIPSKIGNSYCKSAVMPMYIELIYTKPQE